MHYPPTNCTRSRNLHRLGLRLLLILAAFAAALTSLTRAENVPTSTQAIRPGERWLDTSGQFINAHGGGLLFHEGTYYWYGELKEGTTYVTAANKSWGGTRVVNGGVSCYSSTNLYDWKFEGLALHPAQREPNHDLHCEKVLERPKVIHNPRTHQFVMWFHQDEPDYSAAHSGVAVSDTPTGPFHYLGSFRPNANAWPINMTDHDKQADKASKLERDFERGQMARDMTLFVDDDGTAYQFYASEENGTMHVSQLTDDYLKPAGKYARIFVGRSMEAPTVFKHNGKYYLIASGCTGWAPNAARSAVADNIFGPWTELGNPCRGENADNTFHGQSTYVLPVAGRPDTFIAMFDQWKQWDLRDSRYIWLPVRFEDGAPIVEWKASWNLSPLNAPTPPATKN
jgi:hypothetical protein